MTWRSWNDDRPCEQTGERVCGIGMAHQAFTDQKGVEPGGAQPGDMVARGDAALRHTHDISWDAVDEFERSLHAHFKCSQVTIVHADRIGAPLAQGFENAIELTHSVHLDQDVEGEIAGGPGETHQLHTAE